MDHASSEGSNSNLSVFTLRSNIAQVGSVDLSSIDASGVGWKEAKKGKALCFTDNSTKPFVAADNLDLRYIGIHLILIN